MATLQHLNRLFLMTQSIHTIGIMSGSSLDGLDMAHCIIDIRAERSKTLLKPEHIKYQIIQALTIPLSAKIKAQLDSASQMSTEALHALDAQFGQWIGTSIRQHFRLDKIDLISSHGHTIWHKPEAGFSLQIGSGAQIAAITRIPTVCDFRNSDIALGGQGAPLAPMADYYLFSEYTHFINLGGIANIGIIENHRVSGYDICPCNQIINHLAKQLGHPFDPDGRFASEGKCDKALLSRLHRLSYHEKATPKSMSNSYIRSEVFPLIDESSASTNDKLNTMVQYITDRLSETIHDVESAKILFTGGGVHNKYLMHQLEKKIKKEIKLPDERIINYKEALLMALLGSLRWLGKVNIFSSCTGSTHNSSAGAVYLPCR